MVASLDVGRTTAASISQGVTILPIALYMVPNIYPVVGCCACDKITQRKIVKPSESKSTSFYGKLKVVDTHSRV